jgi:hypothetical protein
VPRPPFGLATWTPEADSAAILLDATNADLEDPAAVARQLPDATSLPVSSQVFVLGAAARTVGWPRRWFRPKWVVVRRAPRCAALLARGYVGIGAIVDRDSGADLVYASTPEP